MTASALCQSLLIAVTNFSSKHDFPDAAEEVLFCQGASRKNGLWYV